MRTVAILALCALAMSSAQAVAASFGIRFVVDATTLQSTESRNLMIQSLKQMVVGLNSIYADSDVDLTARIVDVEFFAMQNHDQVTILQEMQSRQGPFADFVGKADRYGADFTVAIIPGLQSGAVASPGPHSVCGASHGSWNLQDLISPDKAYAVINPRCGAYTLAHELGHVMGLNHGVAMARCFPDKKEGVPIVPYALGYAEGECNGEPAREKFGDIMTGGLMQYIDGSPRGLPIFSNPRIHRPECGARGICGDPETGDAARALNENAKYFIKYRSQSH